MKTVSTLSIALVTIILFGICSGLASEVTVPHEFTAGEKALATEVNENFDTIATGVNDNHSRIELLEAAVTAMQAKIADLEAENEALRAEMAAADSETDLRLSVVENNTVLDLNGILTLDTDSETDYERALFTGVNVQIVNGTGDTGGTVNGTGNLIIGYNELRNTGNERTGSHNIVAGTLNNYSSYGGVISGYANNISGDFSSVISGRNCTASGDNSSVTTGMNNTASGHYASISVGYNNTASGNHSGISGGSDNNAAGRGASVNGGSNNHATGESAAVNGGTLNTAGDFCSTVSGGLNHQTALMYQILPD